MTKKELIKLLEEQDIHDIVEAEGRQIRISPKSVLTLARSPHKRNGKWEIKQEAYIVLIKKEEE